MTRVTIRDVAREAGVSVATVSRALRNLPSVAEATRARVREIADGLGYVPDPYAARLGSTIANTVLVAVPLAGQWYYAQVVTGIEAILSEAGYDMTLTVVGGAQQREHFVADILPGLRRVDGTIIVDVDFDAEQTETIVALQAQVVAVGEHYPGLPSVSIDNEQAAHDGVSLLLAGGHRRIGFVGGMRDPGGQDSIPGKRSSGFHRAHAEAGVPVDESLILSGNFSVAGGMESGRALLTREDRPDAIFCLSDEMAIGVLGAARELGLSIPEDLCVLGFDDHDFSEALGLSTVRQPVVDAGETAAQMMLDILDGRPTGRQVLVHEVIKRATTHC